MNLKIAPVIAPTRQSLQYQGSKFSPKPWVLFHDTVPIPERCLLLTHSVLLQLFTYFSFVKRL